jgi:phage/plasmid-like protein (TIGR03299 family)
VPHELDIYNDDEVDMAYVKDVPWHGLGVKLNNPTTAKEAIIAAGLNWDVYLQQMFVPLSNSNQYIPVPKFAVLRNDKTEAAPLGYVTHKYRPLQNRDCFRFFDKLVRPNKAIYVTAGVLREGQYIWLLAKLPESMYIAGEDRVDQYILLTNCHRGLQSVQVVFTPIRVVCWNTLSAAVNTKRKNVRINHYGKLGGQVSKAQEILGLATKIFKNTEEQYQAIAKVSMDSVGAIKYFEELLPNEEVSQRRRRANIRSKMFFLFEQGKGNDVEGIRGTAWAAYNAVTEYIDHIARGDVATEQKLWYSWFGTGRDLRDRALQIALQKVA